MGDRKNYYRTYVTRKCVLCGKEYTQRSDYKSKYCGYECYWESMKVDHTTECPVCGKKFNKREGQTYCSRECQGFAKRGKPHISTGGLSKNRQGYMRVYQNGKYVMQHRMVVEEYLGRKLSDDEIVHHKDHNKSNNDISNLEVMTVSEHTKIHQIDMKKARTKTKSEVDGDKG